MTKIDLEPITVPVSFLWMEGDTLCPEAYQKKWTDKIKTNVGEVNFDAGVNGDSHSYPAGANDI